MILYSPTTKKDYNVELRKFSGEEQSTCPECSESRKKKADKCFSFNHDKQTGRCNHCAAVFFPKKDLKEYKKPPEWENKTNLSDKAVQWFLKRGILQETLIKFKIGEGIEGMPVKDGGYKEINTIQFPYFRNGELVNIKYRGPKKEFKQFKDAEPIFFNLDSIKDSDTCCIVEGEIDCMSVVQAGPIEVISVPSGGTQGKINLDYLDNCIDYFTNKTTIYLATDDDPVGRNLQEHLADRLGKERCLKVKFRESKDANECLQKFGAGGIIEALQNASPFPIEGTYTISDYSDAINDIYQNGLPKGAKTMMTELDKHITYHKGYIYTITGIPSHGKSSLLDQIALQLCVTSGWKGAFYSPENKPTSLHVTNMARKLIGKAWDGPNRISRKEVELVKAYLNDKFFFIKPENNFTLDSILKHIKILKERKGIDFFVIDAWNKLEHKREGKDETEYIGQSLDKLANFCEMTNVLCFLVAHPTKMLKDKNEKYLVPTLYNISGSANFYNKSDAGLCVYRDFDSGTTTVYVQKVKFTHWGKDGFVEFKYDIDSGRFNEYYGGVPSFNNTPWIYDPNDTEPPKIEFEDKPAPF